MSRVYDNWERLVKAVLNREELRRLAFCPSFSSSGSADSSSRFSFDSVVLNGETLPTSDLKVYSIADLKKATQNFRLGFGLRSQSFGNVFKGWVDEKTLMATKPGIGMMVAIKKGDPKSMGVFEKWEILSEVNYSGRLSYPTLIKLLGYCSEEKELLLVYEFMNKGSLENHLFRGSHYSEPLSWDIRLKVAIGAARGLDFLHTSIKKIIYRDFKASNILLYGNYNARLADCDLAILGPSEGESHVETQVMGTHVYLAPEYVATGRLYVKSDVYGFGVVLVEILTGLRALDMSRPNGQTNLVDWVKPLMTQKRKLKSFMDQRIQGQYSSKAAQHNRLLNSLLDAWSPNLEIVLLWEKLSTFWNRFQLWKNPKESKSSFNALIAQVSSVFVSTVPG